MGSRLGSLTANLNKSLITLNNKPLISHIIDFYPPKTKFVIALGFDAQKVKDFLQICYPKKTFYFCQVDNFNGPGSGLRYTLLKCEKKLQEPFVFHACDSIVFGSLPKLNRNWIGVSKYKKNNDYRSIEIKDKKLLFHEKKIKKFFLLTYIGVAGIYDYKVFWNNLKKEKKNIGEISGLKGIVDHPKKISLKKLIWVDAGNALSLKKAKVRNNKSVNILEKKSEAIWFVKDKVVKYHEDSNFIKNRVLRQKILKNYTPNILDWKKNFYTYKKIKGAIVTKKINKKIFKLLLKYLDKFWFQKKINISKKKFFNDSIKFYKNKTYERTKLFLEKNSDIDKIKIINNIKVDNIIKLLSKIDWEYICQGVPCNFHGDLHFENILYMKKNKFALIDWRQDFNGSLKYGDLYYDLSKIMHGIIISHSKVIAGKYNTKFIRKNSAVVRLSISRKYKQLLKFYIDWIKTSNYDLDKVNILTGLIFLNIAPLHSKDYSIYLFNLSKLMLSNKNYVLDSLKI